MFNGNRMHRPAQKSQKKVVIISYKFLAKKYKVMAFNFKIQLPL